METIIRSKLAIILLLKRTLLMEKRFANVFSVDSTLNP
jgi:hypothetical protein